jgi:hypothetical protein
VYFLAVLQFPMKTPAKSFLPIFSFVEVAQLVRAAGKKRQGFGFLLKSVHITHTSLKSCGSLVQFQASTFTGVLYLDTSVKSTNSK